MYDLYSSTKLTELKMHALQYILNINVEIHTIILTNRSLFLPHPLFQKNPLRLDWVYEPFLVL